MILDIEESIMDPVLQCTTHLSTSDYLKLLFIFSRRFTHFLYRHSYSKSLILKRLAVPHSASGLPNNKCALIENIRVILFRVTVRKMEILLSKNQSSFLSGRFSLTDSSFSSMSSQDSRPHAQPNKFNSVESAKTIKSLPQLDEQALPHKKTFIGTRLTW
ncbi:hypothetical protein Tco_0367151 [Tanacetum coccineum]